MRFSHVVSFEIRFIREIKDCQCNFQKKHLKSFRLEFVVRFTSLFVGRATIDQESWTFEKTTISCLCNVVPKNKKDKGQFEWEWNCTSKVVSQTTNPFESQYSFENTWMEFAGNFPQSKALCWFFLNASFGP